jgi:hypothetical protein
VAFLPHARPRLLLADGPHEVLDAAPGGLRLRHTDLVRPFTGEDVQGEVHEARTGEIHPVHGRISWIGSTSVGIVLDQQPLPVGFVMRELAWVRDQTEAASAS